MMPNGQPRHPEPQPPKPPPEPEFDDDDNEEEGGEEEEDEEAAIRAKIGTSNLTSKGVYYGNSRRSRESGRGRPETS